MMKAIVNTQDSRIGYSTGYQIRVANKLFLTSALQALAFDDKQNIIVDDSTDDPTLRLKTVSFLGCCMGTTII